jgi:hypothetical protein
LKYGVSHWIFYFFSSNAYAVSKRTWSQTIKLLYCVAKLTVKSAPEIFSFTLLRPHIFQCLLFFNLSCTSNDFWRLKKCFIRGNMASYKNFKTRRLIGNIAWLNRWSFAASLPISPRWNRLWRRETSFVSSGYWKREKLESGSTFSQSRLSLAMLLRYM